MLKFNIKKHNLKELEKYGFVFSKNLEYCYVDGNVRISGDLIAISQIMIADTSDVIINTHIESENKHLTNIEFTLNDLLYDLIKNELIIKE